jgi:hypothetical protein
VVLVDLSLVFDLDGALTEAGEVVVALTLVCFFCEGMMGCLLKVVVKGLRDGDEGMALVSEDEDRKLTLYRAGAHRQSRSVDFALHGRPHPVKPASSKTNRLEQHHASPFPQHSTFCGDPSSVKQPLKSEVLAKRTQTTLTTSPHAAALNAKGLGQQ